MHLIRATIAVLIVTAVIGSTANAAPHGFDAHSHVTPDETRLGIVDQYGGGAKAITRHDNTLYLAVGSRISIIEMQEGVPGRPIGMTDPLPGIVMDVETDGGFVLAALGAAGVAAVDVSDPANPYTVAVLDGLHFAHDVAWADDRVYIADDSGGLVVSRFDGRTFEVLGIAAPQDRQLTARVAALGHFAFVVNAMGAYRDYYGLRRPELAVVDASDAAAPSLIAPPDQDWGNISAVAVSGSRLYVAGSGDLSGSLSVYDVTSPLRPEHVATVERYWSEAASISVNQQHVVLTGGSGHPDDGWMQAFDISDPDQPSEGFTYFLGGGGVTGAALDGRNVLAVTSAADLHTVDLQGDENTWLIDDTPVGFEANDVRTSGDMAYVAADRSGLASLDLSEPFGPSAVEFASGTRGAPTLLYDHVALDAVRSGADDPATVYVTSLLGDLFATAFRTFVADPDDVLHEVAYLEDHRSWFDKMHVVDGIAYVVNAGHLIGLGPENEGLVILDVSNASIVTELGAIQTSRPTAVVLRGSHAYVSSLVDGVDVVDISESSKPTRAGRVGARELAKDVAIDGTVLYVLYEDRVGVYDLATEPTPSVVGDIPVRADTTALAVDNGLLALGYDEGYYVGESSGICITRVTNPATTPSPICRRVPGSFRSVHVDGDKVLAAMHQGGIVSLQAIVGENSSTYLPFAARTASAAPAR